MAEKKKKLPVTKTQYKKLVNDCLDLISDYKLLFISDLIALSTVRLPLLILSAISSALNSPFPFTHSKTLRSVSESFTPPLTPTFTPTIYFIQRNFRFKHIAVYKFGRCSKIYLAIFDDISDAGTEFFRPTDFRDRLFRQAVRFQPAPATF